METFGVCYMLAFLMCGNGLLPNRLVCVHGESHLSTVEEVDPPMKHSYHTGEVAPETGIYEMSHDGHPGGSREVTLVQQGERFPSCGNAEAGKRTTNSCGWLTMVENN